MGEFARTRKEGSGFGRPTMEGLKASFALDRGDRMPKEANRGDSRPRPPVCDRPVLVRKRAVYEDLSTGKGEDGDNFSTVLSVLTERWRTGSGGRDQLKSKKKQNKNRTE